MSNDAFKPTGNTVCISVTTSASTAVQAPASAGEQASWTYLVSNTTSQAVFLAVGPTSGAAAVIPVAGTPANGVYLGGNTTQTLTFSQSSWFSAIAPTGTSTVYITPGMGI